MIENSVSRDTKAIFYPLDKTAIDPKIVLPKKKIENDVTLDEFAEDGQSKWQIHWKAMPDFIQEENPPYRSLTVKFHNQDDVDAFSKLLQQDINDNTNGAMI